MERTSFQEPMDLYTKKKELSEYMVAVDIGHLTSWMVNVVSQSNVVRKRISSDYVSEQMYSEQVSAPSIHL